MVTILDSYRRMTFVDIYDEYKGKWVYLVDMEGPKYGAYNTAVPKVIADNAFEGHETGIYEKLDIEYNGRTTNVTIPLVEKNYMVGFQEVKINVGGNEDI